MTVLCPICQREGRAAADHDHATGEQRETICRTCNVGLGMFKDDPRSMRRAARYVERHRYRVRHAVKAQRTPQPLCNVYAGGCLSNVTSVALCRMLDSMSSIAK